MESIRDRILKLAANKPKKAKKMTDMAMIERKLIEKMRSDDELEADFAQTQMIKRYRSVIGQEAAKSGLSSVVEPTLAHAYGVKVLKDYMPRYDLEKDIQPNTYFTRALKDRMRKERQKHVFFAAKSTEDLTQKSAHVSRAEELLKIKLGRDPTNEEIHHFVTNDLGRKVDLPNIPRIKAYSRVDLSGNVQIGEGLGAEFMTKMDVSNVDTYTPYESYKDDLNEGEWMSIIRTEFKKKNERRYLYSRMGLGQFKDQGPISVNAAALNNNISNHNARKAEAKFLSMATNKPQMV